MLSQWPESERDFLKSPVGTDAWPPERPRRFCFASPAYVYRSDPPLKRYSSYFSQRVAEKLTYIALHAYVNSRADVSEETRYALIMGMGQLH